MAEPCWKAKYARFRCKDGGGGVAQVEALGLGAAEMREKKGGAEAPPNLIAS